MARQHQCLGRRDVKRWKKQLELNNREEIGLLLSAVVLFISEQLKVHRTLQQESEITHCSKVDFMACFSLLVLGSFCCLPLSALAAVQPQLGGLGGKFNCLIWWKTTLIKQYSPIGAPDFPWNCPAVNWIWPRNGGLCVVICILVWSRGIVPVRERSNTNIQNMFFVSS